MAFLRTEGGGLQPPPRKRPQGDLAGTIQKAGLGGARTQATTTRPPPVPRPPAGRFNQLASAPGTPPAPPAPAAPQIQQLAGAVGGGAPMTPQAPVAPPAPVAPAPATPQVRQLASAVAPGAPLAQAAPPVAPPSAQPAAAPNFAAPPQVQPPPPPAVTPPPGLPPGAGGPPGGGTPPPTTLPSGLPDPATFNYGEAVQEKFQSAWEALPPNMRDPANWQRLQEQSRIDAIPPRDATGRTINQRGYGTDAPRILGKGPGAGNEPVSAEQDAAFRAALRPDDLPGLDQPLREGMIRGENPGTQISEDFQAKVDAARLQSPSFRAAQGLPPLPGAGDRIQQLAAEGASGPRSPLSQALGGSPQPLSPFGSTPGVGGPTGSPQAGANPFAPPAPANQAFSGTDNLRSTQINPATTSGQTSALDQAFAAAGQGGGGMSAAQQRARDAISQGLGNLGGPDRTQLALDAFQQFQEKGEPAFQQRLQDVGRKAAAFGRIGSGVTTSELGDVQQNRERDLARRGQELSTEAAGLTLSDRLSGLGGAVGAAGTLGGLDLGQGQLGLGRAGLIGDLAGQQFQQGLTGREELRGERGFQNQLANTATDRRVQQAQMENQFGGDAFNREQQRLALAGQLGLGGNPFGLLQASGQVPQGNTFGTFAGIGQGQGGGGGGFDLGGLLGGLGGLAGGSSPGQGIFGGQGLGLAGQRPPQTSLFGAPPTFG